MTAGERTVRFAIVGCGYVADYYLATMVNHPGLALAGVTDTDSDRARRMAAVAGVRDYGGLSALLEDPTVAIVANLTNPRNHYEISRACLEAGKHVYSEKPIATEWPRAVELVELAERKGLQIVSAPCAVLGETAQTLWKAVRDGSVGTVRLAYAELDDGMIHREDFRSWLSACGNPWPFRDEFEVGCTLEHAGYSVTWLAAMFGPAESVTAFASAQIPDKVPGVMLDPPDTPDFSCGCIRFASGVVARLTCSIIAPHDHTIRLFGDAGTLAVKETWDFASPVTLMRRNRWTFRAEKYPRLARLVGLGPRRLRPVRRPDFHYDSKRANRLDFARGVAELAEAVREGRLCRLSPRFSLHINEIVLTLQNPAGMGSPRRMTTRFDPVAPMPWAAAP